VSNYVFTSSSGTYTAISGGTVLGSTSNDDDNFTALSIGFNLTYDATVYTQFSVNVNGFIALGSTISSSYTALSSGTTNNIIAAFNYDIESRTDGELSYQLSGTSGNRVMTIQWKNYQRWTTGAANNGDIFNFSD